MQLVNYMKMEFKSHPANVGMARVAVAAFASQLDFNLNDLEDLKVAVSEAVTNAIVHGYDGSQKDTVTIAASLFRHAVQVVVADTGKGIEDVYKAMEAAFTSDPERMGLGFTFMQSFMDDLEVKSAPGQGTSVIMMKKVSNAINALAGN